MDLETTLDKKKYVQVDSDLAGAPWSNWNLANSDQGPSKLQLVNIYKHANPNPLVDKLFKISLWDGHSFVSVFTMFHARELVLLQKLRS